MSIAFSDVKDWTVYHFDVVGDSKMKSIVPVSMLPAFTPYLPLIDRHKNIPTPHNRFHPAHCMQSTTNSSPTLPPCTSSPHTSSSLYRQDVEQTANRGSLRLRPRNRRPITLPPLEFQHLDLPRQHPLSHQRRLRRLRR